MRRTTVVRIAAACGLACGVAAPLVRRRLRLPPPVVSVLSWQAPLALVALAPRSRLRDAGVYALQMWAYTAHYQMPGDDPDGLRRRLRVRYPIVADEWLGLGEIPTVRLQRALGRQRRVLARDVALSAVHWLWYLMPHGSLVYLLLRHRDRFPGSAVQMAAVFDLGLVVYWALPTAPPWWAAEEGRLPPVRRIMTEAGQHVWGRAWDPLYDSIGGNPFAAMPSLHYATSHTAARALSEVGPAAGALGWVYASALAFSLVYLGEHYVVDLVAGLVLAEAVRAAAPAAAPAARVAGRAILRLEPDAAR